MTQVSLDKNAAQTHRFAENKRRMPMSRFQSIFKNHVHDTLFGCYFGLTADGKN